MVLAGLIGEFCLEEEILARDQTCGIGGRQSLTNCSFKVVLALVGCVDGAKAGADSEFGKSGCTVFFPGGAVEEVWDRRWLGVWHGTYSDMG